ncbi:MULTISPECIES: PBSX family phage terminase large subunit [unclassified Streptomyces]|uniref:PBSX family phage terminase large subunit n=1 Tax=unclassified Streptomyces TaxID=2593676 RepID=UPI0033A781F4
MGTTDLRLSDKQERSIAHSTAWLNVWEGSVRSGKTIASLLRWLMYVVTAPHGGQLVVVGKTYDTVARNVFGPLQDPSIVGPHIAKMVTYTRGSSVAWILGRQVEVITANDAKAEARLRGLTGAGAYVDELTLLPKEFFKRLIDRQSVPGALIFATTNPDNPGHWAKKDWLNRADELGIRTWHFTLDDNPALSPEYVARMKAAFTGLWYRRYILGHWVQSEGAIYEMFDEKVHVVDDLPSMTRWPCDAIDYGTVNPFADLLIGLGSDQRLYVVSEYRHDSRTARRQMTDAEYSAARRQWLAAQGVRPDFTVVDPSAASFIEQLHRDNTPGVVPAENTVLDGIRTVASLLAADRLRIHRSCTGLIDELPGYSWDDEAAEKGEDKPIKVDDHSCDALRYGVRTTEALWRPHIPMHLEVAA